MVDLITYWLEILLKQIFCFEVPFPLEADYHQRYSDLYNCLPNSEMAFIGISTL